jgi:hypothetical protein
VPTLDDLFKSAEQRPAQFYRGDDEYDPKNVGFVSKNARSPDGRKLFDFKTSEKGNGATGHSGKYYLMNDGAAGPSAGADYLKDEQGRPYLSYGTDLSAADKEALKEYLKTL